MYVTYMRLLFDKEGRSVQLKYKRAFTIDLLLLGLEVDYSNGPIKPQFNQPGSVLYLSVYLFYTYRINYTYDSFNSIKYGFTA